MAAIGIDFGTTNSAVARVTASGEVELAKFSFEGAIVDAFRSLLYLEQVKERGRTTVKSFTGPEGIEQYLAGKPKSDNLTWSVAIWVALGQIANAGIDRLRRRQVFEAECSGRPVIDCRVIK